MTMYMLHEGEKSLPDKVQVVAAIWADGETFGDAKWVRVILDHRASLALAYQDAIGTLQKGLDENWPVLHCLPRAAPCEGIAVSTGSLRVSGAQFRNCKPTSNKNWAYSAKRNQLGRVVNAENSATVPSVHYFIGDNSRLGCATGR
jgi:hypothetical protein